jgi:hypothetical protein
MALDTVKNFQNLKSRSKSHDIKENISLRVFFLSHSSDQLATFSPSSSSSSSQTFALNSPLLCFHHKYRSLSPPPPPLEPIKRRPITRDEQGHGFKEGRAQSHEQQIHTLSQSRPIELLR